jgi:hypothetical protein
MKPDKFHTANGRLTRYALACGYVERKESDYEMPDYRSVELAMQGSAIVVKVYQRAAKGVAPYQAANGCACCYGQRAQFTTQSLTDARRVYRNQCIELGLEK